VRMRTLSARCHVVSERQSGAAGAGGGQVVGGVVDGEGAVG